MSRPKGSKNRAAPLVDSVPSRCPHCGSTERSPYSEHVREYEITGVHDGQPFTHIVYRPTQCLGCGQWRIDREWVYRPVKK